jgi:hypothetical protein
MHASALAFRLIRLSFSGNVGSRMDNHLAWSIYRRAILTITSVW